MRTSYNADFKDVSAKVSIGAWDSGPREVSLTPNKRGSFGGYGIELDEHLATVLGGREGQKIPPAEMTKRLWQYIKRHNLGKKNSE